MSDPVYITLDTETGGVTIDTSLLTAYFGVLDKDMNLIDSLSLAIKPDDSKPYVVTGQGLGVNKINLVEHDKVAITQSAAGTKLYAFLKQHSNNGKIKLIPVGHNVNFDILHIYEHLLSKPRWDSFVSYRKLDTGMAAQLFKYFGIIPDDKSGSLEYLAERYGVDFGDRAHTADGDALMCVEILKRMKDEYVGSNKKD